MIKVRPFLKWAGNKYSCMDHLLASFPKAQRLIEPFTGSAAVFMNTDYPEYILAESNQDLVALYHYVQQEGASFINDCQALFTGIYNTSEAYYKYRDQFNHTQDRRLRASLFLYLNRHGYNGLCRYNSKGIYNVPFGRYNKPYFPKCEMLLFHQKSQGTTFLQADFKSTFLLAQPGDVIYCDPPYVPINQTSNFSAYTGKKFIETDQCDLANCAIEAMNKGVTVIISNHDTPFTRHQYREAKIKSFKVSRLINCKINHRTPVRELLAIFSP